MDPLVSFGIAIAVSLAVSTAILLALVTPLRRALAKLCPSADATNFWVSFTAVMLYLTPLLFAMWFQPTMPAALLVDVLRWALGAALFGAFAGLLVIGYQVANAKAR